MANPSLTDIDPSNEMRAPMDVAELDCGQSTLQLLDEVQFMVRDILTQWQHPIDSIERRSNHRVPFNKSIALFDIDEQTDQPTGEAYLVTGRDISSHGVGFSHGGPLPHTKVAVGFELPNGCSRFVLVRLTWCRFTRRGTYDSGGMFIRPIPSPDDMKFDWNEIPRW
ncbi:PilZ domain protein [Symmachiella macrocystis]|uniref:PilZ domain protein n=1 Tax=Symmachiella macrocystis TaxID=2527985 RepID=A0A5C6BM43_9PLAN|nr:PilZ domain-containing protein [Symmachiella macrocystis]TWU13200.1 PilZ domain protein [Symmachiella macrocystis]